MKPKIVAHVRKSELEELAQFFHQDFEIAFESVTEGANEHFRSLTFEQRRALISELRQVLQDHLGKSKRGLQNAWRRLGAQYWNRKIDLASSMSSWVAELERSTA